MVTRAELDCDTAASPRVRGQHRVAEVRVLTRLAEDEIREPHRRDVTRRATERLEHAPAVVDLLDIAGVPMGLLSTADLDKVEFAGMPRVQSVRVVGMASVRIDRHGIRWIFNATHSEAAKRIASADLATLIRLTNLAHFNDVQERLERFFAVA